MWSFLCSWFPFLFQFCKIKKTTDFIISTSERSIFLWVIITISKHLEFIILPHIMSVIPLLSKQCGINCEGAVPPHSSFSSIKDNSFCHPVKGWSSSLSVTSYISLYFHIPSLLLENKSELGQRCPSSLAVGMRLIKGLWVRSFSHLCFEMYKHPDTHA